MLRRHHRCKGNLSTFGIFPDLYIQRIEKANPQIWELEFEVNKNKLLSDYKKCLVSMSSDSCRWTAHHARSSSSTCVLSPLLPSSPPSVHGLTRGGDDAIGGQSRTVPPASLPQRTGRKPSLRLLTPPHPPTLPQFILSARGVCRVSGHTPAMTDKAGVTSWSQSLSQLHRKWPQIPSTDQCTHF